MIAKLYGHSMDIAADDEREFEIFGKLNNYPKNFSVELRILETGDRDARVIATYDFPMEIIQGKI